MVRAVSRKRAKAPVRGRKDYTRPIALIAASALCGAIWLAAAEVVMYAVRR
jgi:hypothetical protein